MTERVDFYVLSTATAEQRWRFACRLAEKAYLRASTVILLAATAADARLLDDLLWTFDERSFVPHRLCLDAAADDPTTPVTVTTAEAVGAAGLLVNLSERLPADPHRFARIAEIVDADEGRRRSGRERFRAYRELQLRLETHQHASADA
jgi:DNA polymerase-3 subunit chi